MTWLLTTRLGRWLALFGAAIAALAGAMGWVRRDGRKNAERKARDDDHEAAKDIRDSVRNNRPDELRKHESSGWRD